MSNEVIKDAEEKVETPTSATEQTNQETTTGAAEAPQPATATTQPEAEKTADADDETTQGEMDFGAMLAQFEQEQVAYHIGETVNGKVVRISDQGVLIDFGYKSEGVVDIQEFTDPDGNVTIKQGEDIDVVIKSMSGDGPPALSYQDAQNRRSWDEIEKAFQEDITVTGVIKDKTKGGLRVDLQGVEAFLPGSQIDSRPVRNLDALKGEEIEAKIVKFSRKRNNIVLSRKVITDKIINKQKAETLEKIEVGFIVDGKVKNLTEYGAFIDIGGIDGLLHVTDMSWGRLHNPGDMLKVNDSVQVKILKLDREKEKVSLGFKQLLPDPWSTVTEIYPVNSKIKGTISSVTEYGAFVELEPGVEGLVHVSEMSWAKRMKHPKHFVNKGDEVEVQVLGIDPEERRISLGIKQLQANPWDTIGERFQTGSKVHGKVRNLTDFGAFVEIEDGVDGLVHVSDISWSKKVKHPKDVLKKGQEVEAIVTNIDTEGHRLSLSIKELTPSAWETFTSGHKPGDVVKGKISRFAGFGIFVELAPDLEGLCHISELSDERIENPETEFEVGQELEFKILRVEHDVEKIGLSARAVGKENEPIVDTKTYSSDAKGGMASLGELANLRIGKSEEAAEKPETPESIAVAEALKEEEAAEKDEKVEPAKDSVEAASEEKAAEDSPSEPVEKSDEATAAKADDAVEAEAKPEEVVEAATKVAEGKESSEEEKPAEDSTEAVAKGAGSEKKPAKEAKAKVEDKKVVKKKSEEAVVDVAPEAEGEADAVAEKPVGESEDAMAANADEVSEGDEKKSKSKKAES